MAIRDDSPYSSSRSPSGQPATDLITTLTQEPISRRTVMKRGAAAVMGASMIGPLLAACGSGGSSGGLVNITYAALQDTTGEQVAEIDAFNKKFDGKIKVTYQELPPVATDQYNKFVTAFRSGASTPDVVHIDVTWPAQFAVPGWLAPIDQYVNSDYLKQFWPSAGEVAKVNGKLYGIQRYMDIGMLYYRTDLVQKYGSTPPQTRDEMVTMAQQILAGESANGIKFGYLMPGKKIEAILDEWLEFLWGDGGDIGKPGALNVNGSKQTAALQFMQDLVYKTKLSPPGTNTYAPNDILALFQQGAAPFMRNWTYAYALANDSSQSQVAGKFDVIPTLATSGNDGHGCTGGWLLAINANSQHKDEAWTFIDYLLSKDTQKSMTLNAGLIPSRPDVVSDSSVQAKYPYFAKLDTILNTGYNRPALTNYNQFTTPMQTAINAVLSNQSSPADALKDAQSQVGSLT